METNNTNLVTLLKYAGILLALPLLAVPLPAQTTGSAEKLTRRELAELAIQNSHMVQIQEKKARLSLTDRQKARLTYVPDIDLNASYTRLNDDIMFMVPPIKLPVGPGQVLEKQLDPIVLQEKDIFKTSVDVRMVLFTGLKAPRLAAAAYHKYRAEKALVGRKEAEVILEVMNFTDRLALLNQSLVVLQESQNRLDKQTEYSEKALQAGLASSYDLNKIRIARQQIRKKEIELNGQRNLVLAKLSQLTALEASQLDNADPDLEPWQIINAEFDIQNRAEIRAFNEALLAGDMKRKSEMSGYLPQVMAYGHRELYEDDLSALDPTWYAGVGLKWNLFDGFQRVKDVQKARIEQEIRKEEKEEALQQLNLNLIKAQQDLQVANQLISVAREQAEAAADALKIANKEYQLGLTGITERLTAETDYQSANLELLKAVYDQRMASLNLLDATGELNINKL